MEFGALDNWHEKIGKSGKLNAPLKDSERGKLWHRLSPKTSGRWLV